MKHFGGQKHTGGTFLDSYRPPHLASLWGGQVRVQGFRSAALLLCSKKNPTWSMTLCHLMYRRLSSTSPCCKSARNRCREEPCVARSHDSLPLRNRMTCGLKVQLQKVYKETPTSCEAQHCNIMRLLIGKKNKAKTNLVRDVRLVHVVEELLDLTHKTIRLSTLGRRHKLKLVFWKYRQRELDRWVRKHR